MAKYVFTKYYSVIYHCLPIFLFGNVLIKILSIANFDFIFDTGLTTLVYSCIGLGNRTIRVTSRSPWV